MRGAFLEEGGSAVAAAAARPSGVPADAAVRTAASSSPVHSRWRTTSVGPLPAERSSTFSAAEEEPGVFEPPGVRE